MMCSIRRFERGDSALKGDAWLSRFQFWAAVYYFLMAIVSVVGAIVRFTHQPRVLEDVVSGALLVFIALLMLVMGVTFFLQSRSTREEERIRSQRSQ